MGSLSEDAGIRIQEGVCSYKLPKQDTNDTNVLSFFFLFFFFSGSPFCGESLNLYSPFLLIFTLHLLII